MISLIADNALLGGFAADQRPVGSEIVRQVCGDFDIHDASADSSRPGPQASVPPPSVAPAVRIQINYGILVGALVATFKRFAS